MDDLTEALARAAEFSHFGTQQRYMRWMIAMRKEILRLQTMPERTLSGNAAADLGSAGAPSQQAPSLERRAG
jgi:hypothetical protein